MAADLWFWLWVVLQGVVLQNTPEKRMMLQEATELSQQSGLCPTALGGTGLDPTTQQPSRHSLGSQSSQQGESRGNLTLGCAAHHTEHTKVPDRAAGDTLIPHYWSGTKLTVNQSTETLTWKAARHCLQGETPCPNSQGRDEAGLELQP